MKDGPLDLRRKEFGFRRVWTYSDFNLALNTVSSLSSVSSGLRAMPARVRLLTESLSSLCLARFVKKAFDAGGMLILLSI